MPTSRTIVVAAPGGPEAFGIEDRPAPSAQAGQVIVEVTVSGFNLVDAKIASGAFGPDVFPYVPGCEFAGTVVEVAADVTSFQVGDRVAALALGWTGDPTTWRDRVAFPADRLVRLNDTVSDELAGTNVVVALTALRLARGAGLRTGSSAVIPGAAGGVGRWLVQMLVSDGVLVTTVTSAADLEAMQALGARAISRDDAAALENLADFDVIFDVAGGPAATIAQRKTWIKEAGRYLSITVPGEGIEMLQLQWDADALVELLEAAASGRFAVVPATMYAPEDVRSAVTDVLNRTHPRTALDFRLGR